ncbi:cytochrome-c peroxidase [Enterovibrio coralii]|uniref:Cytochrome B6 n=1 Tax=Enterovibrio coralii TaxID=294935 RepID=A0A135I5G3_9GAMM|nr:cytochrome c peroxidase [Enterovibrio coralii]KXF80695.1 cytochrome B6 [Enterovibrio coralii]
MIDTRVATTVAVASLLGLGVIALTTTDMLSHDAHHDHEHGHGDTHASAEQLDNQALVVPVPVPEQAEMALIKVGWELFNDPNLSSNNAVSCASCHNLSTNGAEITPVSHGVGGAGDRNSLTVFNASLNYRFFWDGRSNTLTKQLDGPIHAPAEMDSSWEDIHRYVEASTRYQGLFNAAGLEISDFNIKHALVTFQEQLLTPNSPFDRYLKGEMNAMNDKAKAGWEDFQSLGCVNCHQGENIGGSIMQRFGYYQATDKPLSEIRDHDTGRHKFTNKEVDKYIFRVASLRNVADTAPYFHDGQTQTLEEAINIMANIQLGRELEPQTVDNLVAFLHALSAPRPAILEVLENE